MKCPAGIQMITIATRMISTARAPQRNRQLEDCLRDVDLECRSEFDRHRDPRQNRHQNSDLVPRRPLQGEIRLLRTEVLTGQTEVNFRLTFSSHEFDVVFSEYNLN